MVLVPIILPSRETVSERENEREREREERKKKWRQRETDSQTDRQTDRERLMKVTRKRSHRTEPRHEKTVFGVCDQAILKPTCSTTEAS